MDDLRCKSYNDSRRQVETYSYGPNGGYSEPNGFRCYSASSSSNNTQMELSAKKGKSSNGSVSKSWSFNDPELQRKKRVASYKVYSVEGKVKGSMKKSFRWIKERCTKVVYGWR
ncbi:hypothetical protein RND71_042403 [Anisodus tanguticus]|uniref:DUF3511 domain protein n=1 Tax=Anisodus tanguticus TaxID=243964 RepID=A0AAE1US87_9SOLA|nr:hypothetical protein RND71_042403 [Anisodus tanguticus]